MEAFKGDRSSVPAKAAAPGGSRSDKWRRDLRQDLSFETALVRRSRFHAAAELF